MAEVNPPIAVETGGEHAQQLRAALADILGHEQGPPLCGSGIAGPFDRDQNDGHLYVSAKGDATMTVVVHAGRAFVLGTENDEQGVYAVRNDGNVELTLDAGGVANRLDSIIARVYDATVHGSGATEWALEVVKGATDGSLAEPDLPDSSIRLATIRVNTTTTEVTGYGDGAGQVRDRRWHHLELRPENYYVASVGYTADTVATGGREVLVIDTVFRDPSGMRTGNKLAAPIDGRYLVTGEARGTSQLGSAFGYVDLSIHNGGTLIVSDSKYVAGIIPYTGNVAREIALNEGNEIDLRIEHNSGGNEAFHGSLHMAWRGPKASGHTP